MVSTKIIKQHFTLPGNKKKQFIQIEISYFLIGIAVHNISISDYSILSTHNIFN